MNNKYIARIELHYASDNDYNALHGYMEAEGFSRTIPASDGYRYHLPPAEYYGESASLDVNATRDLAARAAAKTGRNNAVIVSQLQTWSSRGLVRAEASVSR